MISLPGAVLGGLRAMAESLMTDTCKIEVGADAVGEMGETLNNQYTTVASGVACRVILAGSRGVQRVGERETITEQYRLICPHNTALAVNQRVTLSDGTIYQLVDLSIARTDLVDAQAVMVRIHG